MTSISSKPQKVFVAVLVIEMLLSGRSYSRSKTRVTLLGALEEPSHPTQSVVLPLKSLLSWKATRRLPTASGHFDVGALPA